MQLKRRIIAYREMFNLLLAHLLITYPTYCFMIRTVTMECQYVKKIICLC